MIANVAVFVLTFFAPALVVRLGLRPADLFGEFAVWQLVTYMFVHAGLSHIFFNMLTLYFVGVELERMWGTKYFTKFYFASRNRRRPHAGRARHPAVLIRQSVLLPVDGRRFRRDLRPADGLRALLPHADVPGVLRLPGPGAILRDDPRWDGPALLARRRCRHRAHGAPWRSARQDICI